MNLKAKWYGCWVGVCREMCVLGEGMSGKEGRREGRLDALKGRG